MKVQCFKQIWLSGINSWSFILFKSHFVQNEYRLRITNKCPPGLGMSIGWQIGPSLFLKMMCTDPLNSDVVPLATICDSTVPLNSYGEQKITNSHHYQLHHQNHTGTVLYDSHSSKYKIWITILLSNPLNITTSVGIPFVFRNTINTALGIVLTFIPSSYMPIMVIDDNKKNINKKS